MQKLTIIGRLTKDSELKYTTGGTSVLEMNIAVDDGWGDKKATLWIRASMFGERAEKLAQYLLKGQQVYVEGRLRHQEGNPTAFLRKDGTAGAAFEVTVSELTMLGGKKQQEDDTGF
jgi:single-strand DNA-binding protein